MVVDVLTMLDGTLKGGSSRDVASTDDRDESFGTIFEERMKADNAKPERADASPDKGLRGTNQVKPKSTEDNSDNEQTKVPQTGTGETDSAKTGATDEKAVVTEKIGKEDSAGDEIKLTEEQLTKLAEMMGFSVDEMAKLELLLEGKPGELIASMSDDMKNRLAQLLGTKTGGMSSDQQERVAKLADLLDMDKEDAEMLFKRLKVFSLEIKHGENQAGKVLTDTQKPDKKTHPGSGKLNKVLTDAQKTDQKTQAGNSSFDKEIDDLFNSAKKSGGNIKVDVSSVTDHSGKAAQLNSSTQSVETNAINVVKSDKSGVTQTAPLKETVETSYKTTENRVIEQIVDKVKILSFPKSTLAKIALKPPSLGWVDIKIVMHETGARTTIVVESAAVKQMVDQNIDELKAALNQQGISVEEMNVSVGQQDARSSGGSEQQNGDGKNDFDELAGNGVELDMDGNRLADEIIKAAYNSYLNIRV